MTAEVQLGLGFQAATRRIWAVRELLASVRTSVEREYSDVWVEGEVSNLKAAESGHLYFTLKDGEAQLRVVMFRTSARLLRFRAENGMQLLARGRATVYEARGELQLVAEYLEPKGAGALQIAFEQLKARLAAEGLFDGSRKKGLPALPRKIGVVTSAQGAALRDILNILRRRHETLGVVIYPAQVQGEAAAGEVSAGVEYFNRTKSVDVIVVARGGGSIEDLAAFNDEGLARAIAGSAIPVISAVGHETDFTIADFVADLRAPTPSAAAELVVGPKQEMEELVESLRQRLARGARYRALMARQQWTELAQHGAFARMRQALERRQQRVDELVFGLERGYRRQLEEQRRRWQVAGTRLRHFDLRRVMSGMRREMESRLHALGAAARTLVLGRRGRVEELRARLEELSPVKILERGYALVFDAKGRLVKDASRVKAGEEIRARVARGEIVAEVKKG